MYCHNCGAKAIGKYCTQCGAAIVASPQAMAEPEMQRLPWREETDLYQLMQREKIRTFIGQYAAQARKRMSSGEFLALFDKVTAIAPIPNISLQQMSEVLVPFLQRWGISTGKTATKLVSKPAQEVLIACLCALAKNGYTLDKAEQVSNGLILHAQLPSDMWTWGGDIVLAIEAVSGQTNLSIAVNVKGQLYDWGKSKAVINRIYEDVEAIRVVID